MSGIVHSTGKKLKRKTTKQRKEEAQAQAQAQAKKPLKKPAKPSPMKGKQKAQATQEEARKPAQDREKLEEVDGIQACQDFGGRTCLRVERKGDTTIFIPFDIDGLVVREMQTSKFDSVYKPIPGYPALKAVRHYLKFSQEYGATAEVIGFLGRVININPKEADMATKKKAAKSSEAKDSKKNGVAQPGQKRETAAAMFQSLIMEGKLTDDAIFEKVQAKFDLDDSKRGYVKWYRNYLKKKGHKVPEARA